MHEDGLVWRDGELIAFADATCHVLSHMSARGSQIFDVMAVTVSGDGSATPTYQGVGLRQHVTRFLRSAELMGMEEVGSVGQIEQAIAETVIANSKHNSEGPLVVKMIAAWGDEPSGILPATLKPTVYILIRPGSTPRDAVRVCSATIPKIPASILPPSMKVAASYTPGVRAQLQARAAGFDHTVFKTTDGDLAESTTLSMLVVKDGRILAPPLDSVLDGITRRAVLDVAQHAAIPVEVRGIWWDEVISADELFLSSTTNPVLPVSVLDERTLPAPGPIAQVIAEAMTELYAGRHQLSGQWLTPLAAVT